MPALRKSVSVGRTIPQRMVLDDMPAEEGGLWSRSPGTPRRRGSQPAACGPGGFGPILEGYGRSGTGSGMGLHRPAARFRRERADPHALDISGRSSWPDEQFIGCGHRPTAMGAIGESAGRYCCPRPNARPPGSECVSAGAGPESGGDTRRLARHGMRRGSREWSDRPNRSDPPSTWRLAWALITSA